MIYKPKRLQPRYEQGPAGLTADYAWLLFRGEAEIAFLDGRPGYGQDSRWSVLALEPWLTLQAWPDRLEMNGQSADGDFWRLLQQILDENRLDAIPDLPLQGAASASYHMMPVWRKCAALPERFRQAGQIRIPADQPDFLRLPFIFDGLITILFIRLRLSPAGS
jgi:hypothetical protein